MNTPVSFELAKLLKEKGFNLKVINFYDYERLSTPFDKQRQVDGLINYNPINWNSVKNHYTSAPTIAEVVMWLYEKHGIWISVYSDKSLNWESLFSIKIDWIYPKDSPDAEDNNPKYFEYKGENEFISPTEAYEAAIEYTLNNLI